MPPVKNQYKEFDENALVSVSRIVATTLEMSMKCCPNCEHFDDKSEKCGLNQLRPPAKIIAFGCECFVDGVVPF